MPYAQLIAEVIDAELCTHCGACEPACPKSIIRMNDLVPSLVTDGADSQCGTCNACVEVCPGSNPHTPEVEDMLFGRRRQLDAYWLGIYQDVVAGWSADPAIYAASGSGGSVSTLLAHTLEHLGFDWALVCGRDPERPYRAKPTLCRNAKDVHRFAQSTYQLSAYLAPLRPILDSDDASRGAVAGLACHMQALRALQRQDTRLGERARERIGFMIEIACSSNTLPSGTETLITNDLGLDLGDVTDVRYRDGEPYPGSFTVATKDEQRHRLPLHHAFKHFKDHKTHRCLSCPDWLSGVADISVIDGDPNIYIASLKGASEFKKTGTLLIRTATGRSVLDSAVAAGVLLTEPTELRHVGNLGLERKRSRRHFYESTDRMISTGPIPGFSDAEEVLDDEALLAITDRSHTLRRP